MIEKIRKDRTCKIDSFTFKNSQFLCECGGEMKSTSGVTIIDCGTSSFPLECSKCGKLSRVTIKLNDYDYLEVKDND
jgi:hypothetical protein